MKVVQSVVPALECFFTNLIVYDSNNHLANIYQTLLSPAWEVLLKQSDTSPGGLGRVGYVVYRALPGPIAKAALLQSQVFSAVNQVVLYVILMGLWSSSLICCLTHRVLKYWAHRAISNMPAASRQCLAESALCRAVAFRYLKTSTSLCPMRKASCATCHLTRWQCLQSLS